MQSFVIESLVRITPTYYLNCTDDVSNTKLAFIFNRMTLYESVGVSPCILPPIKLCWIIVLINCAGFLCWLLCWSAGVRFMVSSEKHRRSVPSDVLRFIFVLRGCHIYNQSFSAFLIQNLRMGVADLDKLLIETQAFARTSLLTSCFIGW